MKTYPEAECLFENEFVTLVQLNYEQQIRQRTANGVGVPRGKLVTKRKVGFEIVDHFAKTVTFLHDDRAGALVPTIQRWQADPPHEDEVVDTLLEFSTLNHNPLLFH